MRITFGSRQIEWPSDELGELRESRGLLGDVAALRARMAEDGYLLLRGLIAPDKVTAARTAILEYMAAYEGLEPGVRVLDGVMGQYGKSVGMMGRRAITHTPAVRAVLEGEALRGFYGAYFGERAKTFDYKWLRAVGAEQYTGAHYDVVYMGRGSSRLMTCWVPFGAVEPSQGTLAVCVGSHREAGFARLRETYGRMDVDRDGLDGWFTREPMEIAEAFGGRWATAAFDPGDVITFGMYTMHASTTNRTDRWRLSCDVRWQPATDPVDERWVGAQPQRHGSPGDDKRRSMEEARARWGV